MICAIIQARAGSTRLPGKMLMALGDKPVIWHTITRVKQAKLIDKVVLATTTSPKDKVLMEKSKEFGISGFAGDEADVLDRFYQAAKKYKADVVVRITGDCPFIDPDVIDEVIKLFKSSKVDYASNIRPPTYPDGLDVEVFSFAALKKAWKEATMSSEREHVTPYIWKNKNLFSHANLKNQQDISELRLTIDEKEDLILLKRLLDKIGRSDFRLKDIVETINKNPDLREINKNFARDEGLAKSIREDRCVKTPFSNSVFSGRSQDLYKKAKTLIPGGTQLLSKRPEMFLPDLWPAYYDHAKGCEVWDLDNRKFIDCSYMGIGAPVLGYADDDVNAAVKSVIDKGNMTTLNCPEEVELAEFFCQLHPWAQMARFARTGGEAVAIAVRIARAKTGKDVVLFCGYHGWHDWYLSSNLADDNSLDGHLLPGLEPKGVPRALKDTAIPFKYNDASEFLKLIKKFKGKIAAVIMEPLRNFSPEKGFLETIRDVTKKEGIVLIFDEVTSGFRLRLGGAHLNFKIDPDICVFGKGISNGYPMAVIIGRKEVMDAAQTSFISSTYWTERIGPTAALATLKKMKECNVPEHLIRIGKKVQDGWTLLAKKHNIKVHVSGIYPLGHFSFEYAEPLVLKTLFTQLMLEKGFLASTAFYASFAHKDEHIEKYLRAVDESFAFISKAIKSGNPKQFLKGPVCHSGFKRLT